MSFELIYAVVNDGTGTKLLHKAKEYGIKGGTILYGKGTVNNALLKFLCLYDERKEIVLMGTDSITAKSALENLNQYFKFDRPHHGIVFTVDTCRIYGSAYCQEAEGNGSEERGARDYMYQNIITIVNKGKAEEVIEAAESAGSKGGTIINARGSGIHETMKIFNMEIEPEKEIVMILAKKDTTEGIVQAIRDSLEIDKPGHGIIFVQDIHRTYGLYE